MGIKELLLQMNAQKIIVYYICPHSWKNIAIT